MARPTAAQVRARKRFAAMARSGAFRRRKNPAKRLRLVRKKAPAPRRAPARSRAIRSPFDTGEHRPRVRIMRGSGTERWRPKSPYKGVITRANPRRKKMRRRRSTHVAYRRRTRRNPAPTMLVNPRRRRRGSSKQLRRSRLRSRRNPYMLVNPRRRSRRNRGYRRNPMSVGGLKAIMNKDFLMAGAIGFGGLFVGIKATKYIAQVPFIGAYPRVHGLVTVVAAGLIAWKGKSVHARSFAMGLLISGMWDLAVKNFPTVFALPSAVGVDLMGEEIRMAEIEGTEMEGTEMEGDDYGAAEVVGAGGGYNSGY